MLRTYLCSPVVRETPLSHFVDLFISRHGHSSSRVSKVDAQLFISTDIGIFPGPGFSHPNISLMENI